MYIVNPIARGQYIKLSPTSWKKCNGNVELLDYKIRRCIDLGRKLDVKFSTGCEIYRYAYLNVLASDPFHSEIMAIWEDRDIEPYFVTEKAKRIHKQAIYRRKLTRQQIKNMYDNYS